MNYFNKSPKPFQSQHKKCCSRWRRSLLHLSDKKCSSKDETTKLQAKLGINCLFSLSLVSACTRTNSLLFLPAKLAIPVKWILPASAGLSFSHNSSRHEKKTHLRWNPCVCSYSKARGRILRYKARYRRNSDISFGFIFNEKHYLDY